MKFKKTSNFLIGVALLIFTFSCDAFQKSLDDTQNGGGWHYAMQQQNSPQANLENDTSNQTAILSEVDATPVQKAFEEYQIKYYQFLSKQTEITTETLQEQRSIGKVLMWSVLLVIYAGIIFSGYQLFHATRIKNNIDKEFYSAETSNDSDERQSDTSVSDIEISLSKIRITSSVIGIVVLALSLGFFYLFLVEVYRVTPLSLSASPAQPMRK
ncbi:hypothetical protein QU487_22275 [Crenobacter sp. SG2305]|uniref:hypothetical protein n=1 Tax=Crenobacter oryzisoli TaxID=3056844 RepID=UPI0025AAA64D|nr:hypothetical protein [Crenobacter sp. SG2305]MDN0085430.1 hypothetical protein [Crenobacter sp. SG2305]